MIVLRDRVQLPLISNLEIRDLVDLRILELSEDEPWDSDLLGPFIIMEPGDQLDALNELLGFPILTSRIDGTCFGEPDFAPSHEILEEYPGCYEIVFILSDDGYGFTVFVPKQADVSPELLAMCTRYASPASSG
jgi:hypothetical protein